MQGVKGETTLGEAEEKVYNTEEVRSEGPGEQASLKET